MQLFNGIGYEVVFGWEEVDVFVVWVIWCGDGFCFQYVVFDCFILGCEVVDIVNFVRVDVVVSVQYGCIEVGEFQQCFLFCLFLGWCGGYVLVFIFSSWKVISKVCF